MVRKHDPFVLLVDDHEPGLIRLKKVVEIAGYECEMTLSGADALVLCEARRPSLVVTDLAMPHMDGHGLGRSLRRRYPSLPMLVLTGELLDGPKRAALSRTFHSVLTKPLQVEPFLTLLAELLTQSQAPVPSP